MKRILIVEDDLTLSNGLMLALKTGEREVTAAGTMKQAEEMLDENTCDLMILDINLPDGSGLDFLREIKKTKDFPVILLTANDTEMDIVGGFELGANDYVTKPFSLAVLRARVNAQLERQTPRTVYREGSLLMDFEKMDFRKGSDTIELSKTEQKLLRILVENPGIILTRERLIDYVWSYGGEYVDENALSVTIKRLRDKLEDEPAKPKHIRTVYGMGYVWAVEE